VWQGQIDPCLHQNHVFAVRPNAEILLPEFLAYVASSMAGRRYFTLCSKQSTNLASINSTQLKQFPIPLPPLSEQQRIADILSTWDRAIEQAEKIIDHERRACSSIFGHLYNQTRSIGATRGPNGWSRTTFREIFTEVRELNAHLGPKDVITVGKYDIRKQVEHFNRRVASSDLSRYWVLSPGDFVYDPMSVYYGAIGRFQSSSSGIVSPAYRVLRLRADIDPEFVLGLLTVYHIRFQFETRSTQGNREGKRRILQRPEFARIEFYLPPLHVQKAISATAQEVIQRRNKAPVRVDILKRQRDTIVSQLLNGRLSVIETKRLSHSAPK
jgi:type I restriction enzyme S subunit